MQCDDAFFSSFRSPLEFSLLFSSLLLHQLAPLLHSSPRKTLSPKVSVVTEQQIQPHLQFMTPKNLKGNQNLLFTLDGVLILMKFI